MIHWIHTKPTVLILWRRPMNGRMNRKLCLMPSINSLRVATVHFVSPFSRQWRAGELIQCINEVQQNNIHKLIVYTYIKYSTKLNAVITIITRPLFINYRPINSLIRPININTLFTVLSPSFYAVDWQTPQLFCYHNCSGNSGSTLDFDWRADTVLLVQHDIAIPKQFHVIVHNKIVKF